MLLMVTKRNKLWISVKDNYTKDLEFRTEMFLPTTGSESPWLCDGKPR